MEIKSFPNNKMEYQGAEDLMRWLHGRTSGVFGAEGNSSVTAAGGMAVTVSDGNGWITNKNGDGICWWNDTEEITQSPLALTLAAADSTLNRIDRIIVEWKTIDYADLPEIKVLQGTPASNAVPPALTNSNLLRQISLAQVYVKAGATVITAADITDERQDESVCGIVSQWIGASTKEAEAQFIAMLDETQDRINKTLDATDDQANRTLEAIANRLAELEADNTVVELKKLLFADVTVLADSFVVDDTYQDYPFRAAVELKNKNGENVVLSSMIPNVVYSVASLTDNNFAPVAECYNGGVYIYADSKPTGEVKIDTIICWNGGLT